MNTRKHMRGASLLETMISLSLLATGLLAFLQTDGRILQHNRFSAEQSSAIHLAQQKLAQLQYAPNAISGHEDINDIATRYLRHWQSSTHGNLNHIESRVLWRTADGAQQEIQLGRLVFNFPLSVPITPKVTL